MLFKFYLLSLVAALVTAGLFVLAGQSAGLARDYGPLPVGHGVSVPPHTEVADAPPWLALICTLVADGTLFTSLLFGTFYLWIAAPNWPPAITPEPSRMLALVAVAALVVAAAAARGSLRAVAAGGTARGWIGLAALALLAAIAAVVGLIGGVVAASARACARRDRRRAARLCRPARRHRPSLPRQQPPASRRRLHLAPAARWICA